MRRLDAGLCRLVVNKGCRLSPSTALSSLWFLLLAYIAPVVDIHRTRRLVYLSLAYIALAVRIHRTNLLLTLSMNARPKCLQFDSSLSTDESYGSFTDRQSDPYRSFTNYSSLPPLNIFPKFQ